MTVFYTGKRPVTKGRNWRDASDQFHPIGTYSNRDLLNPSQVLDGFPNTDVVPGAARPYSQPTFLERIYSGAHHIEPMYGAGLGQRLTSTHGRFRPLEYKGLAGAKAFGSGYGHTPDHESDYANYSNFIYDGLAAAEPMADAGHVARAARSYGGRIQPYIYQGAAADKAADNPGHVVSSNPLNNDYGNQKINQWFGVASAKALL